MPTPFDTSFESGDLIEDSHVLQFVPAVNALETGEAFFAADAGFTDAYEITLSPAPAAYTAGMMVNFQANTANTGAATLDVNGLGSKAIRKNGNQALATGDIAAGQIVAVLFDEDGDAFQMVGAGLGSGPLALSSGGTHADLSATGPGYLQQATAGADVTVGPIALGDLDDVDAASPSEGDYLAWDEGEEQWVRRAPLGLVDLADVDAASPSEGDVLRWSTGDNKWILSPPGSGNLDDLTDVDAPSPADGDVLTWSSGDNEWVAAAPTGGGGGGGGGITFDSLYMPSDVVTYGSGILKYNTDNHFTIWMWVDGSGDLYLAEETDIVYLCFRDSFVRNLTLEADTTLYSMGYRILAEESITIDGEVRCTGWEFLFPPMDGANIGPLPHGGDFDAGPYIGGNGGNGGDGDPHAGDDIPGYYVRSSFALHPPNYMAHANLDAVTRGGQKGGTGGRGALEVAIPGGGGEPGGTIMLVAPVISGSGHLNVEGATGVDAYGNDPGVDEAGGGGGGGGGAIILVANEISEFLTTNLNGGAGGLGYDNGDAGGTGTLYTIELPS